MALQALPSRAIAPRATHPPDATTGSGTRAVGVGVSVSVDVRVSAGMGMVVGVSVGVHGDSGGGGACGGRYRDLQEVVAVDEHDLAHAPSIVGWPHKRHVRRAL